LLQAIGSLPAQAGRDGFSGSLVEGRNQRKSGLFERGFKGKMEKFV